MIECEICEYEADADEALESGLIMTLTQYYNLVNKRGKERVERLKASYTQVAEVLALEPTKRDRVRKFVLTYGVRRKTANWICEKINGILSFHPTLNDDDCVALMVNRHYVRQVLNQLSETNLLDCDFQPHGCYSQNRYTSLVPVNEKFYGVNDDE